MSTRSYIVKEFDFVNGAMAATVTTFGHIALARAYTDDSQSLAVCIYNGSGIELYNRVRSRAKPHSVEIPRKKKGRKG